MKKSILIFIVVILIISSLLTIGVINLRNKVVEIESIIVFSKKINTNNNKKIYFIELESGEIKYENGGCTIPFIINLKNGKQITSGFEYYQDGSREAYYAASMNNSIHFDNSNYTYSSYDYFVHVEFLNPLKIDDRCK